MAGLTDIPEVLSGEVLDEVAEVARAVSSTRLVVASLFIGAGVGVVAGYFVADRRLREKYEAQAEEEISQMREHFRQKVVAFQGREETKRPVEEVVEQAGYASPTKAPTKAQIEAVAHNVFQENMGSKDPSADWDYDFELQHRPTEGIYVIHEDEQGEKQYLQHTLTYYEGDDVLADHADHIIDNREEIIGDFQTKWGHGCSDPNVVYVRNDHLASDYEVCRSRGTYAEEVHGLKHADDPPMRRRKLRPHDE